jgi:hypothetical protein
MGQMINVYKIWIGRSEGKGPLGRPMYRWEDSIKVDLREIGWEGVNYSHLAQDRDRWRALANIDEASVSKKAGKFLTSLMYY